MTLSLESLAREIERAEFEFHRLNAGREQWVSGGGHGNPVVRKPYVALSAQQERAICQHAEKLARLRRFAALLKSK